MNFNFTQLILAGAFRNLSKGGQNAVWNTLGTLLNLLPDFSNSTYSTTKSAMSNGTIEVRDGNFNMQTMSRDTSGIKVV